MSALGNWLMVRRVVTIILYKVLRLIFITVQRIFWQVNGTSQKLREVHLPQNYEHCAHVLDVVMCHKFCEAQRTTFGDYLCVHNRFENPQYVIDNDHITLMCIDDYNAFFCEAKEKGVHLWRTKYNAFIRYAQMDTKLIRRLIVVPLSAFHRMAETIGDPTGQLTFLFNVGRCGSTLLTQLMEYSGRCVSLSEPNTTNVVAERYRTQGDTPELRQLTCDVIRWECRPLQTLDPAPLGYFVKLTSASTVALPLFRELFPSSRCLYMYRDILVTANSVYRLSMALPSLRLAFVLGRLSAYLAKLIVDSMGYDGRDYRIRVDNHLIPGVVLYAVCTGAYFDMRRHGEDVAAVRYEDLIASPLSACRVLLEYCGYPASLAEHAVKGFDVDSQRNSPFPKSVIGNIKEPEMTEEIKIGLNALLKQHGMPLIGEPGVLEGTLKFSQ